MNNDKKQFICDESKFISHNERITVLKILRRNCNNKIKYVCNGIKVDLDQLSGEIIDEVYNFIKTKYDQINTE